MIQWKNVLLPALLVWAVACSEVKTEKEGSETDTSATENVSQETSSEEVKPEMKEEESVRTVPEGFDAKIGPFLSTLKRSKMSESLEPGNEVIILTPGPGLYPLVHFGNQLEDFLEVQELKDFFVDPSLIDLPLYQSASDMCDILENSPDGIYISEKSFEELSIADPMDDEAKTERIKAFLERNKSRKGYGLIIKYTNEQILVNILAYEKDGKLFIALMEFSDCSV